MQDEGRLARPSGRYSAALATAQVPLRDSFTFPLAITESVIIKIQWLGADIAIHGGCLCMTQKVKVILSQTCIMTSTEVLLHS